MVGMTLIAFVVSHSVPADPVAAHLGQRSMEDPAIVAAFRQQWGLDKPLPEQYLTYLRNLVQGNLGVSIRTHMPVADDLARYLPASAELAIIATSSAFCWAFRSASSRRSAATSGSTTSSAACRCWACPARCSGWDWSALYVFYFRLGWLPGPGPTGRRHGRAAAT